MPELPIPVTEYDVKEPNLLLRHLRKVTDRLASLGDRLGRLESASPPPSMANVRDALEATGTHPIYLGNLLGQTAEPQPAEVTHFDTVPSGLVLQALRDGQLVTVGSSSTGDTMYRVVGANPNTLRQINPALAGSVIEVADANFTVFDDASTSRKMQFSNGSITAGNTRVMTIPDIDQILAGRNVNNSFTTNQNLSGALYLDADVSFSVSTGRASIHKQVNSGLLMVCVAGATADFQLLTNAGSNIVKVPTGTLNTAWGGKFTQYNAITLSTAGNGVPSIVATANVVATTSSVGTTTVYTTPATPAFAYRVSFNMFGVSTGVSTGEVVSTLSASNGITIVNITSSAMDLQTAGTYYYTSAPLRVGGALPINLMISRTGTSTGTYSAYMAVEAL